jgi:hypothetical protein
VKKAYKGCKTYTQARIMIKLEEKPWPIHVPAAAVIHEWRALSVIIGRIGCVDGKSSYNLL